MVTVWVETVGLCARCSGLTGRLAPGHARSSNLCSTLVCGRQPVRSFGPVNVTWCTAREPGRGVTERLSHGPKCNAGMTAGAPKE